MTTVNTLDLTLPVPCIQGKFNDRIVSYTTQIPPLSIINLLGHDPRSKNWSKLGEDLKGLYQFLQRPTSKDRRESIEGYIEERLGPNPLAIGAFPAISIALNKPAVFMSFDPEGKNINQAVGTLRINVASTNMRVLLDGLGRVTAALDLIDEEKIALVERFLFPVTIYAPAPGEADLSWYDLGQLFHDFNFKVQPVTPQHAIALDRSDLYISLANKLGESSVIKSHGGVAERAASLGNKSTELVVQSVLVRMVRGACEGRAFQEANMSHTEAPNLTKESFPIICKKLEAFIGGLASRLGDRFAAKDQRRDSMLMTAPGWQALGIIFHDTHIRRPMTEFERNAILDRLAAVDWSRYNPDWTKVGLGTPEVDKKSGLPVCDAQGRQRAALSGAGRTNTQLLIDYMRKVAGYPVEKTIEQPASEAAVPVAA